MMTQRSRYDMPEDDNGEVPDGDGDNHDNPDEWRDVCDDPSREDDDA